jgi:hypothetical protein
MHRELRWLLLACTAVSGCGGSTPASPDPVSSVSSFAFRGETVSAVDGRPIGRVSVTIGAQTAVSDDNGRFDVRNLREGGETMVISGGGVVERRKSVTIPGEVSRETLIPASFDLTAFDEMFRGTGRLQRWTAAPALVVLGKVMQFENFAAGERYHATSEQMTEAETTMLIEHLTEGLSLLTGGTFNSFASIAIENPASGAVVDTLRPGAIVVGRYRGVQTLANTIGFGRWANSGGTAEVTGGAIYLDRNYDRSSGDSRLLRIHELGHALGYLHVTARPSIMNPAIGPQPAEFDRVAAAIAFQRMPGNQSPDNDEAGPSRPSTGGLFGIRSLNGTIWSPPIICGPTAEN